MSRFDSPLFQTDEQLVSIWVATCTLDELPDDYLEVDYDAGDEASWNSFAHDFGIGYYDEDMAEGNIPEEEGTEAVSQLLQPMSYADSYIEAASARAAELGLAETEFIFLIFDFAYDPDVTKVSASPYLRFLGVFPYSEF